MNIRLAPPGRGGIAATAIVLGIGMSVGIGAGGATAAPNSSNNGRHVGQSASAAPAPHGATVHNAKAGAKATAKATAKASAQAAKAAAKQQKTQQKAQTAHGAPQANAHATHGAAPMATGATADPPGNNGTVKIAEVGDLDRIPNNSPHPGCSFEVQWYGFDGGSAVVSTVSFTPQAPTSDVTISVDGPTQVPVGEDAASGAGTATGLDAVQTYTLSFSGGAPAKQGYHVRLTVATPRSLGNDTKTKVFWVAPCAPATPAATPAAVVAPPRVDVAAPAPAPSVASAPDAAVFSATPDRVAAPSSGVSGVPTAIDAGQHRSLAARMATSPWAWALVALGLGAMVAGGVIGARRRV
jgi:hypothetical protein